jgi:hypothetical protein
VNGHVTDLYIDRFRATEERQTQTIVHHTIMTTTISRFLSKQIVTRKTDRIDQALSLR